MNIAGATDLIMKLMAEGVQEFICCAGARNAPLVKILNQAKSATVLSFFEERSAGFFALGRIKKTNRPVCVVTTSGTAVGNLMPPVMEAYHAQLPLVVMSADRPESYRGCGAPQSTEQKNIFTQFATCIDVTDLSALPESLEVSNGPLHLNVCFNEPLLDAEVFAIKQRANEYMPPAHQLEKSEIVVKENIQLFLEQSKKPLVIVSQLAAKDQGRVSEILMSLQLPTYVEAHSNLKKHLPCQLFSGEKGLKKMFEAGLFDGVIRVGSVPTVRFWRDMEDQKIPILNFSQLKWSGLSYVKEEPMGLENLNALCEFKVSHKSLESVLSFDSTEYQHLNKLFLRFPECEPHFVAQLITHIPEEDQVFIGNSMAIRQLDLVKPTTELRANVFSQRGLNGIDGLISTGLGLCEKKICTWILVGDLSALYDLSGLWPALRNPELNYKLIIINNSGGKIFQNIFSDPNFENRHGLSFSKWAEMWGMSYKRVGTVRELLTSPQEKIIELQPDAMQTKAFWKAL